MANVFAVGIWRFEMSELDQFLCFRGKGAYCENGEFSFRVGNESWKGKHSCVYISTSFEFEQRGIKNLATYYFGNPHYNWTPKRNRAREVREFLRRLRLILLRQLQMPSENLLKDASATGFNHIAMARNDAFEIPLVDAGYALRKTIPIARARPIPVDARLPNRRALCWR